jgi:hypothetical protein
MVSVLAALSMKVDTAMGMTEHMHLHLKLNLIAAFTSAFLLRF